MRRYLMRHNAITGERIYIIAVTHVPSGIEDNVVEYYIQVRIGEHEISDYIYTIGVQVKDKMSADELHRLFDNGYFDLWIKEIKEKMLEED